MSRKVVYARLHQSAYVPNAGDLGSVFPPQTKTLDGLAMSVDSEGLSMSFSYKGIKKEVLIPHANVVIMELAPLDPPTPITSKKAVA